MPRVPARAVLLSAFLVAPLAHAEKLALEEVLVEARKVAEDSQTVPISMSVVTPEKVESLNAFDFTELDRIVPSLQLGQNSPASATLKIRNVGPDFLRSRFPRRWRSTWTAFPRRSRAACFRRCWISNGWKC